MRENGQLMAKMAAGRRVAEMIEDEMRIGVGTGSTAACAIEAIGARIASSGIRVAGVATSFAAERLARAHGIPLVTLDEVGEIDLAFDGADEVDRHCNLIKGRGAAHAREKVVASVARRFVVLIDGLKRVDVLGSRMPVPVEVLPMAVSPVSRRLREMGAEPTLRMGANKDGPVVTDQGMWLVDAHFGRIDKPGELDRALNQIPGVLAHGLFVGMTTDLLIGISTDEVIHEKVDAR